MAGQASNIGLNPTTAPTTNFGDIMNQGLNRLDRNQEKARLEEERKRQRDLEFEDRYGIPEDLFVLEDTEFRTVNDATTEAVSLYRDRYYDIFKQLKQDPNNVDLKKRLGSVQNSVKRMRASHDKIKAIGEEYLEKLVNDQISGVDEEVWRERLEATDEGRVKVNLDENDNMQYLFYDKDGRLQDVMAYKELINDSLYDRVDLDTELDGLVKRVGTDQIDVVQGGFIKSMNQFGADQQRFVTQWIDSYLGTDEKSLETNPVLADILNQATGGSSKKRKEFTEEERQFAREYLLQQTKDRFNEEVKLKQLSTSSSRPSAAELKQPTPQDINIAFQGSSPKKDAEGRFVFTIGKNVAIDPTKSDRKIDTIKSDKDGNIWVSGEDRRKVKGVQQSDTEESVAEKEGVEVSMVEKLLSADGSVQYYVREPFTTNDSKTINKVGNIFGVEDELGLRNILYQDMVQKFGKDVADQIISSSETKKPQPKIEVPKEVKTESGTVYK